MRSVTYDALTETYVIFITENDVLKSGLPIYHIDRIVQETGEPFGDEAHIIYVNFPNQRRNRTRKTNVRFFLYRSKRYVL